MVPTSPQRPATLLKAWIVAASLLWGGLGFLGGLWVGRESRGPEAPPPWYESYARRLAAEFDLDEEQQVRLRRLLVAYDAEERRIRGDYVLKMEREEERLVGSLRGLTTQLLTEVFTAEQVNLYRARLRARETRRDLTSHERAIGRGE